MKKINVSALFTTFENWLGGFWTLIGGFFKKRLSVITGSYVFTETGCVDYYIDTPDGWLRLEFSPEKVWFTIEQPDDGNLHNMVTMNRESGGVWISGVIQSAPCKVTWIILV